MSIFIHPSSQKKIESLTKRLPQSLLLSGEGGVGLLTISRQLAGKGLALTLQPQNSSGEADPQNGIIAVEKIRELYDHTRAKQTDRHIIILDDADRMSLGAQAAFLKLLEEPNHNIHFILTSHAPERLLPTILSRVQRTMILPITHEQTIQFLAELDITDKTKAAQLHFIAEGLPAEIARLVANNELFSDRAKIMTDARRLLQGEPYDRLLLVNEYQGDRAASLQLTNSMLLIARRSLSQKPQPNLVKQLDKLLDIQSKLEVNHNVRLQLSRCLL